MIVNTAANVDQSIIDTLNKNWRGAKTCQICGQNEWNVESQLAELRFLSLGGFHLGAPVIPLLVITCNTCGNTILINPLKIGWKAPTSAGGQ